jgi:hypothetical protein
MAGSASLLPWLAEPVTFRCQSVFVYGQRNARQAEMEIG